MPIEQRVVSKPKIGAKIGGSSEPAAPPEPEKKAGGGRKKLIVIIAAVVVVAGAAAWFFLGRGGGAAAEPAAEPAPEPGEVVQVEPISVNLADGHYLRLGLGLQLTIDAGGHGPIDPSPALDAAISLYSGRAVAEVNDPATRDALKAELAGILEEKYHGEVMDVYLTNYVTQ